MNDIGPIATPDTRFGVIVSPGGKLIPCESWKEAEVVASTLRKAGHVEADSLVYEPLPDPSPVEISQDEHEAAYARHLEELRGAPVESELPVHSREWREMMFRPGMAQAMMFVLYEVVHKAVAGDYESLDPLVRDLRSWSDLTIPQRESMIDLFVWVEREIYSHQSALPEVVRSNLLTAFASYADAAPQIVSDQA